MNISNVINEFIENAEKVRLALKMYEEVKNAYKDLSMYLNKIKGKIEDVKKEIDLNEKALFYLDKIERIYTQSILLKLESILNKIIKYICGEQYSLKIENGSIYIEKNDEIFDLSNVGGGIVSIILILLRIYSILIIDGERFLFLDEPFVHINRVHLEKLLEIFKILKEKEGFTFVIISHNELVWNNADILIEVEQKEGLSFVKK